MTVTEQQTEMLAVLAQGLSVPPRTPILKAPADYGMEYEDISFETADGVTISGWFIPADSNRVVISNHFSPANRYGFAGHLEGLDFAFADLYFTGPAIGRPVAEGIQVKVDSISDTVTHGGIGGRS